MSDRLYTGLLVLWYLILAAIRHPDSRPIKH